MHYIPTTIVSIILISIPLLWGTLNGVFIKQELVLIVLISFGVAICCNCLVQYKRERTYTITWGDVSIAVFLLAIILNLLLTNESYSNIFLIYQWASLLFVYTLLRSIDHKEVVLYAIVLSGIIQGMIAISQWMGLIESNHHVFGITGTFGNPGQLGGYQSIALLILLCMFADGSQKVKLTRVMFAGASSLILFSIYLADSRASVVALIIGLIFFYSAPIKKLVKKHSITSILTISLFIASIGVVLFQYREGSANARLLVWRVSSDMICDKPVLGHGVAAFKKEYILYQAKYFEQHPSSDFAKVADNVAYPYNEFLHVFIEQGLVGGIIVIILFTIYLISLVSTKNG